MERNLKVDLKYVSTTIKVDTPEGSLFTTIIEDERHKPIAVELMIGKAGSVVRAWTQSLSRMMSLAILHGASIEEIVEDLSAQSSDRNIRMTNGVNIHSGPEGVCYALMLYRNNRHRKKEDGWPKRGRIRRFIP